MINSYSFQPDARRPTVPAVEDSDDTRLVLGVDIRRKGCRVLAATDGREAVVLALRARRC